ncbi:MAG TPA: hypothetical protein VKD26_06680 [Streptosporangiaceae bacterium]|nr:hypothetical protein [Streptosporangiaceae bacterium]
MKIAAVHAVRRTAVGTGLVLVVVVALVFGARGCATTAVGATPQPGEVSLAYARQVFSTFATTDQVARAAGDESLDLTLVSGAQVAQIVSAYERADYTETPVQRYRYGAPALYVPQMNSFPLWFVAVAPRTTAAGGPARTAIMVFSRPTATSSWQLSLSTLLQPGVALPRLALDASGHAIARATFDNGLLVSPNSAGALQAAVADDGPAAQAARVVAAGPYTTGIYDQIVAAKRQATRLGLTYDSLVDGSAWPPYVLGTADGGALVLYTLVHNTVIRTKAAHPSEIAIPPAFAPILYATGHLIIRTELDTGETDQYAAAIPPSQPAGKRPAQMRVIASDGGPTSAGGT